MTENRTDGSTRNPWLWGLIIIVVAIGAWQLLRPNDSGPNAGVPVRDSQPLTGGARPSSGALGAYLQYVDERGVHGAAMPEPALTAEGIRRLADAIAEVGNRNVARSALVRATIDSMLGQAARVETASDPRVRAELVRDTFLSAAAAITRMQEQGFPTLASMSADLRSAAGGVSARLTLEEQRAATQSFFERAAAVLRNMVPQAV